VSVLAKELVSLKVDVIVSVGGNVAALPVKKPVKAIPVVFTAGDPVGLTIPQPLLPQADEVIHP
jgi:ABC-type uncharacterized transport system substrate-binding protein